MRTTIAFIVIGASALGVGCGSSQDQQPQAAEPSARHEQPGMHGGHGGMMGGDMEGMCPMAVEGTTVRAEDVDGGVALAFTTTGDVAELRRRVAHMAEMHERHHGEGGMMKGGMMVAASARSEQIDGGAHLVLTAADPKDVAALRERVHQHAEQMASGKCPMMEDDGAEAAHRHGAGH